ncbi:hypothetical protein KC19_6G013700 [Ceratodon purpureus]|uniref:Uncharacterized protein n=1 Tax=Ceratodon purpureus TaxID=3225 RepID=A0A8T0HCG8_CERPU|nr:hypothetical protein KC19_6G013700 [Ceratodon purpureus]
MTGHQVGGLYHDAPPHTASAAGVGRDPLQPRSPRRMVQDMDLNGPPAPGGTPQQHSPTPNPPTAPPLARAGMASSGHAASIPAVSRQGRRSVEIHLLSSSTATSGAADLKRTMGSTGHRRKRGADTSGIADGVTKSAEKMVKVLSEINETQRSSEKEKLEVHSKHFQQSLEYKKERDRVNMENVRISQEHTRLGLMNQQMVVTAIANLASAISRTVAPSKAPTPDPTATTTEPQEAPPN